MYDASTLYGATSSLSIGYGTTGFSPVTHSLPRQPAAEVRADERPRLLEVLACDRGLDEAHRDPARLARRAAP